MITSEELGSVWKGEIVENHNLTGRNFEFCRGALQNTQEESDAE
jgi:DNA-binding winged helix-turn-helix (wHTH) protein